MLDVSILVWLLFLPSQNGMVQATSTYKSGDECQKVAKELGASDLHLFGNRKPLCIQAKIYK